MYLSIVILLLVVSLIVNTLQAGFMSEQRRRYNKGWPIW